MMMNDDKPDK